MHSGQQHLEPLTDVLERVATAAHQRTSADVSDDHTALEAADHAFLQAATAAVAARMPLSQIAHAEQVGIERAQAEHGKDVIKAVARTARAKRESEAAYEAAVRRAGRLGLAHREVAAAAEVSHTTIRALLARTENTPVEASAIGDSQPDAPVDGNAPSETSEAIAA